MIKTRFFRDQHDEMLALASSILFHLHVDALSKDASKISALISELTSQLNVHLIMEDHTLYPELLEHSDERVRSLARVIVDEMGGLAKAVAVYKKKWSSPLLIQEQPDEFIKQTTVIIGAITRRMNKESNELFGLLDEL